MHITMFVLYGLTIWLAGLAYALIARPDFIVYVTYGGPVIISSAVLFLIVVDAAIWVACRTKDKP